MAAAVLVLLPARGREGTCGVVVIVTVMTDPSLVHWFSGSWWRGGSLRSLHAARVISAAAEKYNFSRINHNSTAQRSGIGASERIRSSCEMSRRHCTQNTPARNTHPTHADRTPTPSFSASSMQSPASTDRYVVRLSGALAALLGRAEGAELPEDDLLGWLRAKGLITYPSPLLVGLLERLPEVLAAEVLPWLPPTDIALFARVGPACRAAVVASSLPRAGTEEGGPLKITELCGSVQRLAWAKANDCPWVAKTCALAARSGRVEVLRWARENRCDWDVWTCAEAAACGHLEVLKWAWDHGCPWVEVNLVDGNHGGYIMNCCACAASSGRLEVLKWLRENGCPWDETTCAWAAEAGHLQVLKWAREHGCPWVEVDEDGSVDIFNCCACAAAGGRLEVLKWLREQDCPWNEVTCALAARGGHLEVLKWAWEHGCPWEENIGDGTDLGCCASAARYGHLEVLKWLREHECPWNELTCACAARGGHLQVSKWALAHHCPWDLRTRQYAEEKGHMELLQWTVEHVLLNEMRRQRSHRFGRTERRAVLRR